jgi:hypothetical protein
MSVARTLAAINPADIYGRPYIKSGVDMPGGIPLPLHSFSNLDE